MSPVNEIGRQAASLGAIADLSIPARIANLSAFLNEVLGAESGLPFNECLVERRDRPAGGVRHGNDEMDTVALSVHTG